MDEERLKISEPLYTLAIASKLSGIPAHSIRQYIDKGLIMPFTTDTGRHLFSDVDILRLKSIKKMIHVGLNITGIKTLFAMIPCWEIRKCPVEVRDSCGAFIDFSAPCWEASHKGKLCQNTDCRTCEIYGLPIECQSLKALIKQLLEKGTAKNP